MKRIHLTGRWEYGRVLLGPLDPEELEGAHVTLEVATGGAKGDPSDVAWDVWEAMKRLAFHGAARVEAHVAMTITLPTAPSLMTVELDFGPDGRPRPFSELRDAMGPERRQRNEQAAHEALYTVDVPDGTGGNDAER